MHHPSHHDPDSDDGGITVGSLFSGYGGLDLAVEEFFGGNTVWFSEINHQVARIFAHHWPQASNLGDITTVDWHAIEPVDVLCGGFPCQDVSIAGRRAGLAPGTRSGLWSHMAAAIDAMQPEFVVIENVRGLLSAMAARSTHEGDDDAHRNPDSATPAGATAVRGMEPDPWGLGDQSTRPLRAAGAVLGDLADLRYDTRWIGLPASLVGAPHPRFRVFILARRRTTANPGGLRLQTWRRDGRSSASSPGHHHPEPPDHRHGPQRATRLTEQAARAGDPVDPDRRHLRRWGHYAAAIARWEHIVGRSAPAPALLTHPDGPRPAPAFVEWVMGLDHGWVTDSRHGLTTNQQITALGNGVLPLQAVTALNCLI